MLKNLLQRGHLNKAVVCERGGGGGHLGVLQWARANGCPWDEETCANAAEGGHLETLKWGARERAARGKRTRARYAAKGGHLEVLQWARENGCPWGRPTCASRRGAATSRC